MTYKDLSNIVLITEKEIEYYLLQTKLIDDKLSYEIFLIDILNQSKYFRAKSGGNLYKMPLSQAKGECDAVTDNYSLDFKLLINNKAIEYLNKVKNKHDYSKLKEGIMLVETSNTEKKKASFPCMLNRFICFNPEEDNMDLKHIINYLKTQKNLMLYYPYEIDKIHNYNKKDNYESLFNSYFSKILETRNQVGFETYICLYIIDSFYLFEWNGLNVFFVDKIPELLCAEYRNIKLLALQK